MSDVLLILQVNIGHHLRQRLKSLELKKFSLEARCHGNMNRVNDMVKQDNHLA